MNARKMSRWGWGYADKFPDLEVRRGMANHLAAMFGFDGLAPIEPVTDDAIALTAPRVAAPKRLEAICSADAQARMRHTYGKSYRDLVRGFAGDYRAAPDVVASPTNDDEVSAVLEWASAARVAVIPFGGGTSVVGGVEAAVGDGFTGVVSLDLSRFDRVLEVDPVSRSARIQAGVFGPALNEQLGAQGFALRHYPQSYQHSTLGGWIATRAGGHYATLCTHIDDFVQATRMITPAGHWSSRRLPGSGAGPSPDRLVLGSEGTLGVITEAWVRVAPRPRHRGKATVRFAEYKAAVAAVRAISQAGLHPANCRLLDSREAMINMVATDGSAVLLLGFESADHPIRGGLERAIAIAKNQGGTLPEPPVYRDEGHTEQTADAGKWRDAFFEMPYMQNSMVSLGVIADTFETACTWDQFETLHAAVIDGVRAAMGRVAGKGLISCRFTHVYPDGPAPYFTFLAPARRGAELEQWAEIKKAASDALIANGGTITHHHAVGRTHRPWYDQQRPDLFAAALRGAKAAVDPSGVMNPGVLIDP